LLPAVCPIRHCLKRWLSLNSCHTCICTCKAEIERNVLFVNLCLFVPVAQTVNSGIYFVFLKVCMNAVRRIILEILYNILITLHIHSPCHIMFLSQTNCSLTELHVTAVCYWNSRTDSIHRFSPICEIQQKATVGPTAITIRNSRGLQPRTDVVCRRSALFVTGLVLCISCCVQIVYKFQEIHYHLMHFSI
jgi:hypothetical protein